MKENPVYRNIQFDPRIWGVSYKSLFGALGILLLGIMLLKSMLGLLGGLAAGTGLALGYYAYSYWNDNRDQVESSGKKTPVRSMIAAYSTGTQTVKIRGRGNA